MAVPSSGELQLSKIYNEVDVDNYNGINSPPANLSLDALHAGTYGTINTDSAQYPDNTNPHQMSEWRSYDHDATPAWNNDTDWYVAARGATAAGAEKFRFDFSFNDCYDGNGTDVEDQGTWSVDGELDNFTNTSFTASTSTTTPGFFTFDGTNDKINITSNQSVNLYNGFTIAIWHRCHSNHNGILFSSDDQNGGERSFQIKKKSDGKFGPVWFDPSGGSVNNFQTGFTNSSSNWQLCVYSWDNFSGNKGTTYRARGWRSGSGSGSNLTPLDENLTTNDDSNNCSPNLCIGQQEDGALNTNPFDGDIGMINIVVGQGAWDETKAESYFDDTKSKFGF